MKFYINNIYWGTTKLFKSEKILRPCLFFIILAAFMSLGIQTAAGQERNPVRSPAENPPWVKVEEAETPGLSPQTIKPSMVLIRMVRSSR